MNGKVKQCWKRERTHKIRCKRITKSIDRLFDKMGMIEIEGEMYYTLKTD